ncbi:hypothetical protein GCM10010461_27790 [Microbacterium aurantiacum]
MRTHTPFRPESEELRTPLAALSAAYAPGPAAHSPARAGRRYRARVGPNSSVSAPAGAWARTRAVAARIGGVRYGGTAQHSSPPRTPVPAAPRAELLRFSAGGRVCAHTHAVPARIRGVRYGGTAVRR